MVEDEEGKPGKNGEKDNVKERVKGEYDRITEGFDDERSKISETLLKPDLSSLKAALSSSSDRSGASEEDSPGSLVNRFSGSKLKIFFSVLLVGFLVGLAGVFGVYQNPEQPVSETDSLVDVTVGPENLLYSVKRGFEDQKLSQASGIRRVELKLYNAEKRLVEAGMTEDNNFLLEEYLDNLEDVRGMSVDGSADRLRAVAEKHLGMAGETGLGSEDVSKMEGRLDDMLFVVTDNNTVRLSDSLRQADQITKTLRDDPSVNREVLLLKYNDQLQQMIRVYNSPDISGSEREEMSRRLDSSLGVYLRRLNYLDRNGVETGTLGVVIEGTRDFRRELGD